jgi:cation:H+ antiporter
MLASIVLLVVGFALLIFGATFLVNGATSLAARFGVPDLVIGLTVVAFGTSLPELTVNTFNSVNRLNDAVFGNVIGSNVFNTLFILGFTGLIFPIVVEKRTVAYEVPLSIVITLVLLLLVNDHVLGENADGLSLLDAAILTACFVVFIIYIFRSIKNTAPQELSEIKVKPTYMSVLLIVAGLGMMVYGGYQTTENAVFIAKHFGMSEKLIALTILSIGTSLPELATSAVAAYKRNASIAVGNVIGSNIFNIAFILGISGFIHPVNYDVVMNKDMLVLLFGSSLLMLAMITGGKMKLDRWEAAILLITYILYMVYIIQRN